jgi:Protein of unknown function (DUF2924)
LGCYDSLSKVAFAITGTKWNGPRFFGCTLNDSVKKQPLEALASAALPPLFSFGQLLL